MKKVFLIFLFTIPFVLGLSFPINSFADCGGGNVTGAYYGTFCTPSGCDPLIPPCSCVETCDGVTLISEYCSDYTTCSSCVDVNFSEMDCGNKGRCDWNGSYSCGGATPTPVPGATPTPEPTPVPGCPGAIADQEPNCSATGLMGRYYEGGGPSYLAGIRYDCGPRDSPPFASCGYWNATWDGYFIAPTEGDYQFMFKYHPVLKVRIDVNNNNAFDACPANRLGDAYFFRGRSCADRHRPVDIRKFRNNGIDSDSDCGWTGCDCWSDPATYTPCTVGRHCENVDRNIWIYGNNEPQSRHKPSKISNYITPVSNRGTAECPINRDDFNYNLEGEGWVFFTRHLTAGRHKIHIKYTNKRGDSTAPGMVKMWYRLPASDNLNFPGSGGWISALGGCPFTPCNTLTCTVTSTPVCNAAGTQITTVWNVASNNFNINQIEGRFNKTPYGDWPTGSGDQSLNWGTATSGTNVANIAGNTNYSTSVAVYESTPNAARSNYICKSTDTTKNCPIPISDPWWQVKDGDVQTNGDLYLSVPTGLYFGLPGLGGFPGVAKYGGSTSLSSAKVSAKGWLANSSYTPPNNRVQNYAYFRRLVPSDVALNPVSLFPSGGTASYGYYWYEYDASVTGLDLSITSPIALPDGRKVILLVTGADLNIEESITYSPGRSIFVALADHNINIDPLVGGAVDPNFDLMGFFLADGNISTGVSANPLHVKGSVAALGGLNLQRNLGASLNPTTASEVFEYDPASAFLFPPKLSIEKTRWKEVAP